MKSLVGRIEKLELEQAAFDREFSDTELAVRMAWIIAHGGPNADRLHEILAAKNVKSEEQRLLVPMRAP